MCMSHVSARDLRNHTRDVLRRVESGEPIEITVNRRPVAELRPMTARPTWISGAAMEEVLTSSRADASLLEDLRPLREQTVEPR
jgi:prevent-host-death family protein